MTVQIADGGMNDGFSYPNVVDIIRVSVVDTNVSVEDRLDEFPSTFDLKQNYPNPFNPETSITYNLTKPGNVSLQVFDITGRHIAELTQGYTQAGTHSVVWDGKNQNGQAVASGLYLYRLDVDGTASTRTMTLLK